MKKLFLIPVVVLGIAACSSPEYISDAAATNRACRPYGGVLAVDARYNVVVCKDNVARDYTNRDK